MVERSHLSIGEVLGSERPPSVQALHDFLRAERGYDGSYKSMRKYVRARFGMPPVRPFRRVETRTSLRDGTGLGDQGGGSRRRYALKKPRHRPVASQPTQSQSARCAAERQSPKRRQYVHPSRGQSLRNSGI